MNIAKVKEHVRALKNGYEIKDEELISYINAVEQTILTTIVRGREGEEAELENFGGYDMETAQDKELLAPDPYDVIYEQYAAAAIDMMFEDGERYMNDMAVYHNTYKELKQYWWRTHRQKRNYPYYL